jgi:hypothetical protein
MELLVFSCITTPYKYSAPTGAKDCRISNISGLPGTQYRHHFPEIGAFMNYKRAHTK